MCFSMYTTIPMPYIEWEEKYYKYIVIYLSFVGLAIGLIWFFLTNIICNFIIPLTIKTLIVCLIPLFLSGFIHIDGYMDTCDAIFSRANLEKKHKILKDSLVGAFAVIGILVLSFIYYISIYEILKASKNLIALVFIPIFSRGITSLFIIKIKPISKEGFIASFKKDLDNKHFFIILLILILFFCFGYYFNVYKIILINILCCIFFGFFCIRDLKGISGDLCGFIITTSSTTSLLFLAML